LTANLSDLELISKRYFEEKQGGKTTETADLAVKIIDLISSPNFVFKVKEKALVSENTTTYLYENSATYPFLFDFLAEILHSKIPIMVEDAKLGPGEILVTDGNKEAADAKMSLAIKKLRELIHAKKAESTFR
jgi:hypothetical protein